VKPSQQSKRTLVGCRKVGDFERDNKTDEDVPTSLIERLVGTWFGMYCGNLEDLIEMSAFSLYPEPRGRHHCGTEP
jgi:hypothetical protein